MHVRIDQPGQHMLPGGVDHLSRGRAGGYADRRDAPVPDADIGRLHAPRQNADTVADQQVKMLSHGSFLYLAAS